MTRSKGVLVLVWVAVIVIAHTISHAADDTEGSLDSSDEIDWPFEPLDEIREIGNSSREYQHYPQFGIPPRFHGGVDIMAAPLADKLRAVIDGQVHVEDTNDIGSRYRSIRIYNSDARTMFMYLHTALPEKGVKDAAEKQEPIGENLVLAEIVSWSCGFYHHVHFSRYRVPPGVDFTDENGNEVAWHEWQDWHLYETDPLAVIVPYEDSVAPEIGAIEVVQNVSHTTIQPDQVAGKVDIVAEIWDHNQTEGLKTGDINARLSIKPAIVGSGTIASWEDLFEGELLPPQQAASVIFDDASTSDACGSYGERFNYVLTNRVSGGYDEVNGAWDTTLVPNGGYEIEVTVWDRQSTTTRTERVEVMN